MQEEARNVSGKEDLKGARVIHKYKRSKKISSNMCNRNKLREIASKHVLWEYRKIEGQ